MLIACWSTKGGSGTTVVSVALAVLLARRSPGGVVLADLAGDAAAVLGLTEPSGPGLAEWLAAGPEVAPDGLGRLALEAAPGLRLLPPGQAPLPASDGDGERLVAALAGAPTVGPGVAPVVVADCGDPEPGPTLAVASGATLSLLVIRPCYLALRRAVAAPLRPSAVVLVVEDGRSLGPGDVEDVLGVPVRAVIPYDPAVARIVDAGLLATRLPRGLARALRRAA